MVRCPGPGRVWTSAHCALVWPLPACRAVRAHPPPISAYRNTAYRNRMAERRGDETTHALARFCPDLSPLDPLRTENTVGKRSEERLGRPTYSGLCPRAKLREVESNGNARPATCDGVGDPGRGRHRTRGWRRAVRLCGPWAPGACKPSTSRPTRHNRRSAHTKCRWSHRDDPEYEPWASATIQRRRMRMLWLRLQNASRQQSLHPGSSPCTTAPPLPRQLL